MIKPVNWEAYARLLRRKLMNRYLLIEHGDGPDLVCKTTSKTFQAYWHEMRRHEVVLQAIFAKDKHHLHVPEEVGSVNQVSPTKRHIVTFRRCAICMKELTPEKK